jgi:hypothetical protein
MPERLVDVLNDKNNVLHVFPVQIEADDVPVKDTDLEQEALKQPSPQRSLLQRKCRN